jgi:ADP-heptose:LPS heptosyltransferase
MQKPHHQHAGWYLALHHLHNPERVSNGILVPDAGPMPKDFQNQDWLFCAPHLFTAPNWRDCVKMWFKSLAENGVLVLYAPDVRFIEAAPGAPRFTRADLLQAFQEVNGAEFLENDTVEGHSFIVVRKNSKAQGIVNRAWVKKEKHLAFWRFGVHGDALMAASVLPHLKEQGYTITAFTHPQGYECLKEDPHIDEFCVLARDQLTDGERGNFLKALSGRFDKVLNMADSCEGILLPRPHRGSFYWSDEQRRAMCGGSYLANTHRIAGAPGPYRVKFYPTPEEKNWALEKAREFGPFILWQLRGGGFHKWWPYMPQAVCQLMANTDHMVILAGDEESQGDANAITQACIDYFGSADRLRSLVKQKSIRHVMELAKHADLVIGPETGVMHAVSLEPVPKILLLSHSGHSNLSADWKNAKAIFPTSPCWPCHRMHESWNSCHKDNATGAAACMASVPLKKLVDMALNILEIPLPAEMQHPPALKVVST